jgi:hypothetical protein
MQGGAMELLESPWFFRMVKQQGRTPAQRLLAIFSVTEAWISAPGIREHMLEKNAAPSRSLYACSELREFLTEIATAARARHPISLVNQLVILLQGAIAEEIRNPHAHAIMEAGKAARAIIDKACQRQRPHLRLAMGGMAAAALIVAAGLQPAVQALWKPVVHAAPRGLVYTAGPVRDLNPDSIDAVLALHEQIEKGVCPAPQLLALPPGQATAYMNIIQFRTPDNPAADHENIRAFLSWYSSVRSSECYTPPSNGHTTVAWVAG